MPPKTDIKVVNNASFRAFYLSANIIGASITSGGTGKKEDSAKLNAARYFSACRCLDHNKTWSYIF